MTREEQRRLSECRRQLDKAEKLRAKEYGFKQSRGFVFKFVADFAYWVSTHISGDGKNVVAKIPLKYIPLDIVFWDVFEMPENRKQPKSFHLCGAFVSEFFWLDNEFHIPIETSVDDAYCQALKKANVLIDKYSRNLNTVSDFKQLIENEERQGLNLILLEILEENYQMALDILARERVAGRSGGFSAVNGGNIYDYAQRYCQGKLMRKDKARMAKFSLDWKGSVYDHEGLSASVFGDAIRGFCKEHDDYIILTPTPSIGYSSYLQTHSPTESTNGCMPVEIRFDYPDGSFKHFCYETADKEEIYWIFANYWAKEELPDMTKFKDVTEELYPQK